MNDNVKSAATSAPPSATAPADSYAKIPSRFDWVPAVGAAITIFGILGFAAGRTYTWRYWSEYGASPLQFSLPVVDVIYFGYGTSVEDFVWLLVAACFAFLAAAIAMSVSRPLGNRLDHWLREEAEAEGTY